MNQGKTIRVFVADDHPVVRDGLKALIAAQSGMELVGEASDGPSAVGEILRTRPDVVVMDIAMPELGGAEVTARIKKEAPELKVLALTAHEDRAYLQVMLEAGASGYLLKRAAPDDLVRAIETVATGGIYVDPAMARYAVASVQRRSGTAARNGQLSERETEVLQAMAQGHSTKEIAARLEVGPRTIETYKARAMEKLELKNRADIVRYAVQRGWLRGS